MNSYKFKYALIIDSEEDVYEYGEMIGHGNTEEDAIKIVAQKIWDSEMMDDAEGFGVIGETCVVNEGYLDYADSDKKEVDF